MNEQALRTAIRESHDFLERQHLFKALWRLEHQADGEAEQQSVELDSANHDQAETHDQPQNQPECVA